MTLGGTLSHQISYYCLHKCRALSRAGQHCTGHASIYLRSVSKWKHNLNKKDMHTHKYCWLAPTERFSFTQVPYKQKKNCLQIRSWESMSIYSCAEHCQFAIHVKLVPEAIGVSTMNCIVRKILSTKAYLLCSHILHIAHVKHLACWHLALRTTASIR